MKLLKIQSEDMGIMSLILGIFLYMGIIMAFGSHDVLSYEEYELVSVSIAPRIEMQGDTLTLGQDIIVKYVEEVDAETHWRAGAVRFEVDPEIESPTIIFKTTRTLLFGFIDVTGHQTLSPCITVKSTQIHKPCITMQDLRDIQ